MMTTWSPFFRIGLLSARTIVGTSKAKAKTSRVMDLAMVGVLGDCGGGYRMSVREIPPRSNDFSAHRPGRHRIQNWNQISEELPRTRCPGVAAGEVEAGLALAGAQCRVDRYFQILVAAAGVGKTPEDIRRPRHGISRHRHARGKGFDYHQTKRVGPARKYENIGVGIHLRQRFAHQPA